MAAAAPALQPVSGAAQPARTVRAGIVGVGNRGFALLQTALGIAGVEVVAVCDIDPARVERARQAVEKAGHKAPEGYSQGERDFERLVARDDLDAVINATPWAMHVPVSLAAMKAGKYVGTEVPAALSVEDCWTLVKTSEQTRMPCMMLENVCYFRNVMMVLNMIRQGAFGELIHCAGGYQHDVRYIKFNPGGSLRWRGAHATAHNGNAYPTHPIGPIAWWMDINRGDRFTMLTSMSTVSHGMKHYAERKFGAASAATKHHYVEGDINTTLLRTEKGYTVRLGYETQTARPYDLGFVVQGIKGVYSGTLDKIYLESADPDKAEAWEGLEPFYRKYEHPMWREAQSVAAKYGHGGGDYLVLREFFQAVRERSATPIDVYDSVTWSAIVPLSERSVAQNSQPVEFPDFTAGRWRTAKPLAL
jgi:hypothetical protein